MHIIKAINETNRPEIIYFLLTAYVEALWQEHTTCAIPEMALKLPLTGLQDIQVRLAALGREFNAQQINWDKHDPDKLTEAIGVFGCAAIRLRVLSNQPGNTNTPTPEPCHA